MTKKIISGVMALILTFSLVACGKDDDDSESRKKSKSDRSSSKIVTEDDKDETEKETKKAKETKKEKETKKAKETEKEKEKKSDIDAGFSADGTYTSANGYSMKLPAGWTESSTTTSGGVTDVLSDSSGNNLTFVAIPSDEQFESADEDFFKNVYLQSLGDSVELKSYELVEIAGCKAHKLKFTSTYASFVMHQAQVFIAVDDDVYIFTYTDVDGSKPEVFENAMDSLTIVD